MTIGSLSSANPPELAEWSRQYDVLFAVTVNDATAYLRLPTHDELTHVFVCFNGTHLLVELLHICWLGGAAELKVVSSEQDGLLFMAVMECMVGHLSEWAESYHSR